VGERTRSGLYAARPRVLDCEGGCGTSIEQNPDGTKLKRWCASCRNRRYRDRYRPLTKCLDCPVEGRFGSGQQRCEECRAERRAEEEARRAAREARTAAPPCYTSLHFQLREARGRAANLDCVECGEAAHEWSYDHSDPNELTEARRGRQVRYSLDHDRYRPMCRSCHTAFDARESDARKECFAPECETRILDRFDFCHSHRPGAAKDRSGSKGQGRRPGDGLDPEITALVLQRAGQSVDTCRRCKEEKPVAEFARDSARPKGYITLCRPCASAISNERYYRRRAALLAGSHQ
jgi:hypothetical protein